MFKRFFRMPARQLDPSSPLAAAISWLIGLVSHPGPATLGATWGSRYRDGFDKPTATPWRP